MGKCLVTKLNASVSNSDILRLGEMRIWRDKVDSPTSGTQTFGIGVSTPVTLEIVGNGYFTDETLTANKGTVLTLPTGDNDVWVSNTDAKVAILNKYAITRLTSYFYNQTSGQYSKNLHVDLSDLKYSPNLNFLKLDNSQVTGDIANFTNKTALTGLNLGGTQITGDIASLSNLTLLATLNLGGTQVTGYIGKLANLTALTNLNLGQTKVRGDIGGISNATKLSIISLPAENITGDLSKLPASCYFISFASKNSTVKPISNWTSRLSTANIFSIEGAPIVDNIDKMLQDLAQCKAAIPSSGESWYKKITATGTRTSASDAAVQTLQSKGYTVSITPA